MNEAWLERQTATPEARREYEQERLILHVTDALYGLMEDSGLTKAELAQILGTSRSYITQIFNGSRNMTLRTVSDFAWSCGHRVSVRFEPLRDGAFISAPVQLCRSPEARVVKTTVENVPINAETVDNPLAA